MKKRKRCFMAALVLAVFGGSGLWGLPALAAADNSGVLQESPPRDDGKGHYELVDGAVL